jgi:hypothetical protein
MRIVLGAVAVEVRSVFAGDLLRVSEMSVMRPAQEFRVGLSPTADLPLPMPPFPLLRVAGDALELQVPDGMRARTGERLLVHGDRVAANEAATVRWRDVEIVIVPAAPASSRRLAPERAWPLELLSSTVVSVVALAAIFPAMALLLIVDRREPHDRPVHAHIVYTHRQPSGLSGASPRRTGRHKSASVSSKGAHVAPIDVRASAREAAAHAGILGLFDGQVGFHHDGSTDISDGNDSRSYADPSEVGEAYGVGGLGLVGSGGAGDGTGQGTIGLGNLGTIGRGSGYGRGEGGVGGRRAYAPDVVAGTAQVRGALDKELIRRVIRRHLNEVRFCYEKALQNAPTLGGRVMVEFLIEPDGSVRASAARDSTLPDASVGACTAGAFLRWQFPTARGGGPILVHYPFDFVPGGP